jgi:preprotein translocase subunit SecD
MLYFSRWKALGTILVALVFCLFAVPNFFSPATLKSLPTWAQRHIVLGLDLQGGSHILLEVDLNDVRKQRAETLRDDVRKVLRDARIGYTGLVARGLTVEVRIREGSDSQQALTKLRELSQPLGGLLNATGQRSVDVTDAGGGLIQLTITQPAITERVRQVIEQATQILERRLNALGTVEPVIQRQGVDRILVQVPGVDDPQRIIKIVGETAQLTFRMVDQTMSAEQAQEGRAPPESEVLAPYDGKEAGKYLIEKRVIVTGEDLTDAQPGFDQRTSEPIVSFKFNTNGARRFAQATQENVGRPFAIVLDNKVISAPVIREPILGGQGQISGSFTVQGANDLAILLRAGALPARLTPIEQRVVGAGLGKDSIEKGTNASYIGALLVIASMLAIYGTFGLIASIAVAVNVAMIFGILSLINATLTLPGIIGIVLTIGIAVDSNVLIYERIREEVRAGRSAVAAIDAGFTRALATILDSNITTFIAATVLFIIGTGPVRGFAVTLGVGILTTVFTAFTLTRLIVSWWYQWRRPQKLQIS